jgi:hypothetical protein
MVETQRHFTIGMITFFVLFTAISAKAAVDSRGEINVEGDNQGRAPASSTVTLIVALTIDRSSAELGREDIKTIEIILLQTVKFWEIDFRFVHRDGEPIAAEPAVTGNILRVALTNPITDLSNAFYEIVFDSRIPETTGSANFSVRLRNKEDRPIGESIKPGNVDGKSNNNDFSLQVIPNVPPDSVQGFAVEINSTGENNVIIRWQKSADSDVNGYFIYRDADRPINVEPSSATVFQDVNVPLGTHSYTITAYKTPLLQSTRSEPIFVNVLEDTASPEPPAGVTIKAVGGRIEVTWDGSPTRDVAEYQLLFWRLGELPSPLVDEEGNEVRKIPADESREFIDARALGVGVFIYAVEAIDEAGNRSEQTSQTLRILGEPFPNPFTPLSTNADFNRVVFPARAIENAEGEFTVLIFDINGGLVSELKGDAGARQLEWNGEDEDGNVVESGVYVYQMQVGESFKTGTIIVAK